MSATPCNCRENVRRLPQQVSVMRRELKNLRHQIDGSIRSQRKQLTSLQTIVTNVAQEKGQINHPSPVNPERSNISLEQGCIHTVPIGYISSCFAAKNGTPRQPTICGPSRASLKIEQAVFNNPDHPLGGLDHYSHVWIIFLFHKNGRMSYKAKVKPPRLNGQRMGVYATRSPHRPNALGLTLAKLEHVAGDTLYLSGVDMIAGTPVLDIKPYIPDYDSPQTRADADPCVSLSDEGPISSSQQIAKLQDDETQIIDEDEEEEVLKREPNAIQYSGAPLPPKWEKGERGASEIPGADLPCSSGQVSDLLAGVQDYLHRREPFAEEAPGEVEGGMESSEGSERAASCPLRSSEARPCYGEEARSTIASWVREPPVSELQVRFTPHAERELREFGPPDCKDNGRPRFRFLLGPDEAAAAIRGILSADPRSVYRRTRCQDRLFFFTLDTADITCWFGDGFAEVLQVRPVDTLEKHSTDSHCHRNRPAVVKGDFVRTRRLVESGVDVNARDGEGRTPLMLCCLHNGESWAFGVARMLLVHRAKVGLTDTCRRSALIYAVLYERFQLVRLFLQALDFDPLRPDSSGQTSLLYAARSGNRLIHDLLLQTVRRHGLKSDVSGTTSPSVRRANQSVKRRASNSTIKAKPTIKSNSEGGVITLPYRPLPENLWAKTESISLPLGPKTPLLTKGRSKRREENVVEKVPHDAATAPATVKNWRLDMRSLMETLQAQMSPSHRPRAQPRPPSPRPRRRLSRPAVGTALDVALRQRRQRGRKMSLGALDESLREDGRSAGRFRRRCSVAVIPMVRLAGSRRPSLPILEGSQRGRGDGVTSKLAQNLLQNPTKTKP